MIQALQKTMTFEEFLEWRPENSRYELHEGVVFEMQPTGEHEEIVGFLLVELAVALRQRNLLYLIPQKALIKTPSNDGAYSPDVLLLDPNALKEEPLWKKSSTITQGKSAPLVVEVVSSNWRDDYLKKLADYETLGIVEYWIVDYLALGGRLYIGNPKQPTISIYQFVDGEYQVKKFRDDERIESAIFPELNLTVKQIFQAGRLNS